MHMKLDISLCTKNNYIVAQMFLCLFPRRSIRLVRKKKLTLLQRNYWRQPLNYCHCFPIGRCVFQTFHLLQTILIFLTIEEKEKQITEQKEYRMRLLEAFHDDLISRTEYDMMRQRYTQRIDALQASLASLHERRQALEEGTADTRNWVAEYTKFRKIDKLTREMVAGLIRRITVSEGKQITIQFNYADELESYQQMITAAAKEVG